MFESIYHYFYREWPTALGHLICYPTCDTEVNFSAPSTSAQTTMHEHTANTQMCWEWYTGIVGRYSYEIHRRCTRVLPQFILLSSSSLTNITVYSVHGLLLIGFFPPHLLTEWRHCTDDCILQRPLQCGEEAPPDRGHCQHH